MIAGKEQPDSGEVKIGQTVKMSLIDQSREGLQNDKTVFDNIAEGRDILQVGQFEIPARQYLGRFNFKGSDQSKITGQLSGGERGRLHLAKPCWAVAMCCCWTNRPTTSTWDPARVGRRIAGICRQRDGDFARPLVPRPYCYAYLGLRSATQMGVL